MGTQPWRVKVMGLCGDYLGWDSEIGEFNSRNQSRKRYAKREQVKIDALSERKEDEAFKVPETFCCGTYDPARVGLILAKRGKVKRAPWKRGWSWCKTLINPCLFWGNMRPFQFSIQRMFWFPFCFLIAYYAMQMHYQKDMGFLCLRNIMHKTECEKSPNTTTTTTSMPDTEFHLDEKEYVECCRKWTKQKYKDWGARAEKLSSLLTFLLGIYVGRIVVSWWSQVCGNPDIDNSVLMFAGLASIKNPKFRLPIRKEDTNGKTSYVSSRDFPRAVLEAEKMIARYGLLSWTLCFNTMSPIFRKGFNTFEKLRKKGLLNDREETELKAVSSDKSDQVCSDLWSTPLAWCATLIKEIGPNGEVYEEDGKEEENQRIICKDHKDMLACLLKFKSALDDQKAKSDNSLPKFYKHVLKWALYTWTVFAIFFPQHTLHHTEWNLGLLPTLLYNFPGSTLITLIALHAWLSMTIVLDDPYSGNLLHDINLEEELELRIWGSSQLIKQQNLKIKPGITTKEDVIIQEELWKLIKPEN